MNLLKYFIITLIFVCPPMILAQAVELDEENVPLTQVTSIYKEPGITGTRSSANIKAYWRESYHAINRDGTLLVHSEKLISRNNRIELSDLPISGRSVFNPRFSKTMNLLFYWDVFGEGYERTLVFYDLEQRKIIRSFPFTYLPHEPISYNEVSDDGSTFAIKIGTDYLHVYDQIDGEYVKSVLGPYGTRSEMLSQTGDRIFFFIHEGPDQQEKDLKFVYVEKTLDGWSDLKEVPELIHNSGFVSDAGLQMSPIALTNDGKTLVLRSNRGELLLIHEKDGIWSKPEYVGDFKLLKYHEDYLRKFPWLNTWAYYRDLPVSCSTDGRVIAIAQPREYSLLDFQLSSYDILVFIKDHQGQWNKHQVNPPDVGVYDVLMLSGDGSKLFWVPKQSLSFISDISDYR